VLVLDGSAGAATGTPETLRRTSVTYAELADSWVDPGAVPGPAAREPAKRKVHQRVNPRAVERN
jgi:hypothetical protein